MKRRAAEENTPIPAIYSSVLSQMAGSSAASQMPPLHSVDSTLYNARHSKRPPLPTTTDEIVFTPALRSLPNGEDFLIYQSPETIILGTRDNLRRLAFASDWFMDGTFDAAPKLFSQLFTIHVFVGDKQFPMIYALMTEKSRAAYTDLFRKLQDAVAEMGLAFQPRKITCDFESGLLPSLREMFPNTPIQWCYFHFCQVITVINSAMPFPV